MSWKIAVLIILRTDLKGNNCELISLFLCSVAGHGVGLYPGADRVTVYNGNNIISFSNQKTRNNMHFACITWYCHHVFKKYMRQDNFFSDTLEVPEFVIKSYLPINFEISASLQLVEFTRQREFKRSLFCFGLLQFWCAFLWYFQR